MAKKLGLIAQTGALCFLCACAVHRGPVTDHFDGTHFRNSEKGHTFIDEVRWLWEMKTVSWPEWVDDPDQPRPVERVGDNALRVTYINHATVLIQTDGINILTDPIWSMRAGPFSWFGVKRVRSPGISYEHLPPIDYVLISHDHYDHLDLPTLRRLDGDHHPRFITGLGTGSRLASAGISDIIELDWWESHRPSAARTGFTFVPALHSSGRAPFSTDRTLWGGFIIKTAGGEVYFAGDTGYGAFIQEICVRFRRIRLAILPVGSYEKRWFMKTEHMNPDDAVRVHRELNAAQSMGVHFGTFAEHPEQAIDAHETDLAEAIAKENLDPTRFWLLMFGEGRDVPMLPSTSVLEINHVLRNDILLSKRSDFCIVVDERGLRKCPESPLLTRIYPAIQDTPFTQP